MATRRRRARAAPRRRSSARRSSYSAPRRRTATRRVRSGSRRTSAQTLRIVIEQPTANPIGRDLIGKNVVPTAEPKKAKF